MLLWTAGRGEALHRAGLTAVPCWVREMSDDDAFMALVLSNAQSELSALERGMHALQSGLSVRDYAKKAGDRSATAVAYERQAAEVFTRVNSPSDLDQYPRHLAEIHAAPASAWPALVRHLLADKWTVKATQEAVPTG